MKTKLENYIKFSLKLESGIWKKRSVVEHIEKEDKHQLWECKRSQNSQRKKQKARESSIGGAGEVEEKG